MNLKIGGSNVGKIMYNGQEFGGATKLEPGTILYMSNSFEVTIKNLHLLSTTKDWSNVNGINIAFGYDDLTDAYGRVNVPSDDFKNLDTKKEYKATSGLIITVSKSIVDGEYRLNASASVARQYRFVVKTI